VDWFYERKKPEQFESKTIDLQHLFRKEHNANQFPMKTDDLIVHHLNASSTQFQSLKKKTHSIALEEEAEHPHQSPERRQSTRSTSIRTHTWRSGSDIRNRGVRSRSGTRSRSSTSRSWQRTSVCLHASTLRVHNRNIHGAVAGRARRLRRSSGSAARSLIVIDLLRRGAGHRGRIATHDAGGSAGVVGVAVGGAGVGVRDRDGLDVGCERRFGEVGVAASPLHRAGRGGWVSSVPEAEVHLHGGLGVLVVS
jgi:hypothetical protein